MPMRFILLHFLSHPFHLLFIPSILQIFIIRRKRRLNSSVLEGFYIEPIYSDPQGESRLNFSQNKLRSTLFLRLCRYKAVAPFLRYLVRGSEAELLYVTFPFFQQLFTGFMPPFHSGNGISSQPSFTPLQLNFLPYGFRIVF